MEKNFSEEHLRDLPLQTENLAFKPEEMILCAKCERTNPPTRVNCFYCGTQLEPNEAQSQFLKPNLRKLEIWEKGFNVIYLPNSQNLKKEKLSSVAEMLKLEKDILQKLFEARKSLPLVRLETEKEAEIIQKRLKEAEVETRILSDEDLAVEKQPRRMRGIEFFDDKLVFVLFNRDEIVEIPKEDLALIVSGVNFQKKIEAIEKHSKKGENKILQTAEMASDEILIDLYNQQNKIGFRILGKGFDFSCLESEKGILVAENMKKLVRKLSEVAPNAKFIDDYLQVREILGNVWEIEHKSDSLGLTRGGFGKFNMGNVATTDNSAQFTKYSRLQWHLL
jgi:hypothetical protein